VVKAYVLRITASVVNGEVLGMFMVMNPSLETQPSIRRLLEHYPGYAFLPGF
jgi:hypothetical protein